MRRRLRALIEWAVPWFDRAKVNQDARLTRRVLEQANAVLERRPVTGTERIREAYRLSGNRIHPRR